MKFNASALLSIVIGFISTLMVILILLNHSYNEFEDDYQRKADLVFSSAYDMMLQHKIMLNALKSFFDASAIVTPEEFNLFSEELLKIKSAVAFTLNDRNTLRYVSDPSFKSDIMSGEFVENEGDDFYEMRGYSTILFHIDEPNMPYLVYAISHERVQQRIDSHSGVCVQLTLDNITFENSNCLNPSISWLSSLFSYSGADIIAIPEYAQQYNLNVRYWAPKKETYEVFVLVLLIMAMGFTISVLLYLKVRNHLHMAQLAIQTNSKIALLSTINHEIRTPINAVLGYSNMLKNSDYCDLSGRATLDKIIWSANLLNSVAENTLNFSKSVAGHLKLENKEVDLFNELKNIDEYYQAFSQIHSKRLVMQHHGALPDSMLLDSTKFFQLTTNFINNAFKYSSGPEVIFDISLKSSRLQHFIRVAVKDSGKGMSAGSMKAITQPFNTGSELGHNDQSGIGIGLYTCKRVIEDVGGSIRIRSAENRGTLVVFRFPYHPIERVNHRADGFNASLTGNGITNNKASVMGEQRSNNEHVSPLPPSLAHSSLLLVDDNRFNLEVCSNILQNEGFNVSVKADDVSALTEFSQLQPNIVVMDYRLGNTDGLTLISKMKKKQIHQVHYFILSANDKSEIPNAEAYPDIAYLQKPLNIDVFLQLLDLKQKLA
ncbi:ATP-binding protein [Shewanella sp. UCD-KL12]|uniref:ATP-binding response regulator n=1 Tax=Shewanella sp. UCD-KL12 TaxID=1917163 RepID=UPI0009705ECA|nr:ATP-binding protein [Shewanella sp. UCD-KL12]